MSRKLALKRIVFSIPLMIYTYVGGAIIGFILFPLAMLNILWQLITGRDGLGNDFIANFFEWMVGNTLFVLTTNGDWRWLP
jgi:hypothetical protein